jgi:hypothetical protein
MSYVDSLTRENFFDSFFRSSAGTVYVGQRLLDPDSMSVSPSYQVIFLGQDDSRRESIIQRVRDRLDDIGVGAKAVAFLDESTAPTRDRHLPAMAIFLGAASVVINSGVVADLMSDSVVIAPVVSALTQVHLEIPPQLHNVNALEIDTDGFWLERIASLVLETFRLLRIERRLFISYRRKDAQPFAERLYDALDARGFDVFIDVRSVPPAADFQSELWHRMSDSDIIVLVDTHGFRKSRWTTQELAQANATNIQILHLLWPGQKEDSSSSFSHFLPLKRRDFALGWPAGGRNVKAETLSRICSEAERLRARAIAARHRYLIDNFCDAARDVGLVPTVQSERWIAVPLKTGRTLAVIPAVGVPTSDRINAIFDAVADKSTKMRDLWVIYDNRGILSDWLSHLDWLDAHLPIRAVRMAGAPDLLKGVA